MRAFVKIKVVTMKPSEIVNKNSFVVGVFSPTLNVCMYRWNYKNGGNYMMI